MQNTSHINRPGWYQLPNRIFLNKFLGITAFALFTSAIARVRENGVIYLIRSRRFLNLKHLLILFFLIWFQTIAVDEAFGQDFAGGSGTEAEPYQIETWEHLHNVRENLDAYFVLNNDLDESTDGYATYVKDGETLANDGKGWDPIGTPFQPFVGTFEGGGFAIETITINRPDQNDVGLFGRIGRDGEVARLGVSVQITGDSNGPGGEELVGGLAGFNDGSIQEVYVRGLVVGADFVGGLVGSNGSEGRIENSYATASVKGNNVAGFSGVNFGAIINSYAIGLVVGDGNDVGGLVGSNSIMDISGSVTASFWNTTTSGQATSDGGTGKTTTELKTLSTFTDDGWDFNEETGVWAIEQGNRLSYPYLQSFGYDEPGAEPAVNPIPGLTGPLYAGGSGTETSPYQITNWEHLHNVRFNLDANFVLNNDLDESTDGYATYVKDGGTLANDGKGWEPIGDPTNPFTGSFDGNNNTLSNLSINSDDAYQGLFGVVSGGSIKNLTLSNVSMETSEDNIGSLVGRVVVADGKSVAIENITLNGSNITSSSGEYIGGLIGYIRNSNDETAQVSLERIEINNLTINANDEYVGGLVGRIEVRGDTDVDISVDNVMIRNLDIEVHDFQNYVGGIAGRARNSGSGETTLRQLAVRNGNIKAVDSRRVGGLIGRMHNDTLLDERNLFIGSVKGGYEAGGLVGRLSSNSVLNFGYVHADVIGHTTGENGRVGIITGYTSGNDQKITEIYAVGTAKHATEDANVEGYRGGVIGHSDSDGDEFEDIYYHVTDDSGLPFLGGDGNPRVKNATELTAEQMQGTEARLNMKGIADPSHWDFTENWVANEGDYPIFRWEAEEFDIPVDEPILFAGGDGSADAPFQIANWQHLYNVRLNLDAHFVLNNDLDENADDYTTYVKDGGTLANDGKGWEPIGGEGDPFKGVLDGNGYAISNLFIDSNTAHMGLFGYIGQGSQVSNIHIRDANITSSDVRVGILAGILDGHVARTHVSGIISANGRVGGLAGKARVNSSTTEVSSVITITSTGERAGGLFGSNRGDISNSYAIGSVSGTDRVAGLVGNNLSGQVTNNYVAVELSSSGSSWVGGVIGDRAGGTINHNFVDEDVANTGNSGRGTFRSTEEMKTLSTFTDAGWDFEGVEGEAAIWKIEQDRVISYPYLTGIDYDEPFAEPVIHPIPGLEAVIKPPAELVITEGQSQIALVSNELNIDPVVRVLDEDGHPLESIKVLFEVIAGEGSVEVAESLSDADGFASPGKWTLGSTPGLNTLRSIVEDSDPELSVEFNATGTDLPSITIQSVVSNINMPTIEGSSNQEKGAEVSLQLVDSDENLLVDNSGEPLRYTTTVGEDGAWIVEITDALAEGEYEVTASLTDAAGNTAQVTSVITILSVPSVVSLIPVAVDSQGVLPVEPYLEWEASDNADYYQLQLSEGIPADFGSDGLIIDEEVSGANFQVVDSLDFDRLYAWRVRAGYQAGWSDWSEPLEFTTEARAPQLVFPVAGSDDVSTAPSFQWADTEGYRWRVQLSLDTGFEQNVRDSLVENPELNVEGLADQTRYYWRVRVELDRTVSRWTHGEFVTRVAPEDTPSVQVTQSVEFGGTSTTAGKDISQFDYRLVGLPGASPQEVSSLFDGTYGENWRVFADNGAADEFYQEWDEQENQFKFTPGAGYWVLSTQEVSLNYELDPVGANTRDGYDLELQPGWNIISNPYAFEVAWSDVMKLNDYSGAAWGYNGQFTESDILKPLQAYYIYNDPDNPLDRMLIPYSGVDRRQDVNEQSEAGQRQAQVGASLSLTAHVEGSEKDMSVGLYEPLSAEQKSHQVLRYAHPSLEMARSGMYLTSEQVQRGGVSRAPLKPQSGIQTIELVMKAEVGQQVTWTALFEGMDPSKTVMLLNPVTNQTWMLSDHQPVDIPVSEPLSRLEVFVGLSLELEEMRQSMMPATIELQQNYPNPFNPVTNIRFSIPQQQHVRMEVYDMIGRRVQVLQDGVLSAGWHNAQFVGRNLASGVYFYRLTAGSTVQTERMTLIK